MTPALRAAIVRELRCEGAWLAEHEGKFVRDARRAGMTATEAVRERLHGYGINLVEDSDAQWSGAVPTWQWSPLLLLLVAEAVEAGDLP